MAKKRISIDRFGNPYQLVGCKINEKGFSKGYAELGGKLYKIEPSEAQKDGVGFWVKITLVKKRPDVNNM